MQDVVHRLRLRQSNGADTQTYALGVNEVWDVEAGKSNEGHVEHTIGSPLDHWTFGNGFLYHMADNRIAVGLNVALDYRNAYLNPYEEFQQWKRHPHIAKVLQGGRCLEYGARVLTQGAASVQSCGCNLCQSMAAGSAVIEQCMSLSRRAVQSCMICK